MTLAAKKIEVRLYMYEQHRLNGKIATRYVGSPEKTDTFIKHTG